MSPLLPLASLIILANLVAARPYSYGPRAEAPPTRLANRIVVQSPSLDNLYMDYVVTSKPLNLRKYNKNGTDENQSHSSRVGEHNKEDHNAAPTDDDI
ncbi:uncharacterized protein LOC122621477 isoform X2 [Drosophila teissieri]|uniref:uncharacterized protein LOC122621477 isoform X2 n=1 Tax=Drosophila teissieri TaxID=7243 RepID=UPI001CBA02F0|nr:uncharacterized protein LOC122621477 isoform X2 [Drosophila teissieri]